MNRKFFLTSVLLGSQILVPQIASASWQYDYFGDYALGQVPSETVVIDNTRPKVDETINAKFQIRNGKNKVEGAKFKVYHLDHYRSLSETAGCVNWDTKDSHLLATVNLPNLSANQLYEGETSFVASANNGFSRMNGSNNIVFLFEDGNQSLQLGCNSSNYLVYLDDAKLDYADLIFENVTAPSEVDLASNAPIQINYTLKNVGKKQTMGSFQVCLERRAEGIYPDTYPNRPAFCKQFYGSGDEIQAGATFSGSFSLIPNSDSFSLNQFAQNYKIKSGRNRMVLAVNEQVLMSEEDYSNNEAVFFIDAKGNAEVPVKEVVKPVETTKTVSPVTPVNSSFSEGDIVKSPMHASVYLYKNGKRHAFVNRAVYATWFKDFSNLKNIGVEQMEKIPLGEPVSIKPGTMLLKFPLNPRVYEVADEGFIRHISNEKQALDKYGADWNRKIIELPEIYFLFYTVLE
ncbi:MAG: hypothetical protein A3J66_01495 [Candidatus Magasanikbacteria bacterium RIFCSPHIGHO2_02_FULL_47_14]|uniref:CARDB domain-containing protein n=1 Tax=Candidatus Magasanikbacteria bacterium RIFCSPHIGHO2_02_FULL_47_14 TaxID=1798680 RepID=A0A1F6MBA9_9BACT|nr:MAG: hypothetical protein A3J66_01495 [Candidatus Magasanikbacteria bacterium RIFCSPHIGHO2_02_FULL_47_14]